MKRSLPYLSLLAATLLAATLLAQPQSKPTIAFPDFSSTDGLALVHDAKRAGKSLRIAPAKTWQRGAAWTKEKQQVAAGFETIFRFQLTNQDHVFSYLGADGFAFVIQNGGLKAIGGEGGSGGFAIGDPGQRSTTAGIPTSFAVFFDTYLNINAGDPSRNYISINANGRLKELQWPPRRLAHTPQLTTNLRDTKVHNVRIVYRPPLMSVYLDDLDSPLLTASLNLSSITDADGRAYVGFTASTGGGYQNHDILSWSFYAAGTATDSNMSVVDSGIKFMNAACLPDRTLCTPETAVIEETAPGRFHIVLPAHLEWGAGIPNPKSQPVRVLNAIGNVCWETPKGAFAGCNGPEGIPLSGPAFLAPKLPAGSLIVRTRQGRTSFSVNDRSGAPFTDNSGFFEFDAVLVP